MQKVAMNYFGWLTKKIIELRRERRRAQHKSYNASDKGRARNARYDFSGKGRARHRWYNTTTNGRLRAKTYRDHVNLMWSINGQKNRRSNVPERRSRAALVGGFDRLLVEVMR
jgi:hypothetical protein